MNWPSVGVVIPTRNRPELVRKAIAAVRAQRYPGEMKVVVVYDQTEPDYLLASTDGVPVLVLTNWRTSGLAGARNTGILALDTEYVAFCDDDDTWAPEKLRRQVAALLAESESEFATCAIAVEFEGRTTPRLAHCSRVTVDDLARSRMAMLHSSSFLIRRAALAEDGIGLVAEDAPGSQNEDWDLLLRAARRAPDRAPGRTAGLRAVGADVALRVRIRHQDLVAALDDATAPGDRRLPAGRRPGVRPTGLLVGRHRQPQRGLAVQQGGGPGELAGAPDGDRAGRHDRSGQGGERSLGSAPARTRNLNPGVAKVTLLRTPDRQVVFGCVRNSADDLMLAQQRQSAILDRVRAAGGVRVSELASEYGVSDMTIRRDLESLADRGLLAKVHGGATTVSPGSAHEPGFAAKSVRQRAEKAAMAMRAAALVSPGDAIALSAGTTTAGLAQRLVDVPSLTVVTNSIPVADIFYRAGRPDQTVVLTGGTRTPSDALVGPVAVAAIGTLHLDMLFLGVHGMSERAGYTTPNLMEADVNRALVEASEQLVVLADHTKWGTVGISSIVALERADVVITDDGLDDTARALLAEGVAELMVVSVA